MSDLYYDTETQYILELTVKGEPEVRCTKAHPCKLKHLPVRNGTLRVFHPDAKVVSTDGSVGWDEQYQCPNCHLTWWVEIDG